MNSIKSSSPLVFIWAFSLAAAGSAGQSIEVELHRERLGLSGSLVGMTNIFFQPLKEGAIRFPEGWKDIEVADILKNDALAPIRAIRYRRGNDTHYVVDTDGDLDFQDEQILQFQPVEELAVAEVMVEVRPTAKNEQKTFKVPYQIILAEKYSYARIAEGRRGRMELDGRAYDVFLRPRSKKHPLYSLAPETVCLIDFNGDGAFSSSWKLSQSGDALPSEVIDLSAPFVVGRHRMRAASLDPGGTRLILQPSAQEYAVSVGFKAPPFRLVSLGNDSFDLAKLSGKIVLLEFWSVHCLWCARILPEVNALIARNKGDDLVALAVARETDRQEVSAYLTEHPRQAEVVPYDESLWQTCNPQMATPLYYLIDPRGTVVLSAPGAKSELMRVIGKLIKDLRKDN